MATLRMTPRSVCVRLGMPFASAVVYLLGVCWFLLFPLVCITTGEGKPRGTYFSENALLPGHAREAFELSGSTSSKDASALLSTLTANRSEFVAPCPPPAHLRAHKDTYTDEYAHTCAAAAASLPSFPGTGEASQGESESESESKGMQANGEEKDPLSHTNVDNSGGEDENDDEVIDGHIPTHAMRKTLARRLAVQMAALGLETYVQSFTIASPSSKQRRRNTQMLTRYNVYGILRAPRGMGSRKESIVLATHYEHLVRLQDSHEHTGGSQGKRKGVSGLELVFSLVRYLTQVPWLSKDIVFLAAAGSTNTHRHSPLYSAHSAGVDCDWDRGFSLGVREWLQEYHRPSNTQSNTHTIPFGSGTKSGYCFGRAGVIRSAVFVDIFGRVEERKRGHTRTRGALLSAILPGINGRLPNLDLFNVLESSARNLLLTHGRGDGVSLGANALEDNDTFAGFRRRCSAAVDAVSARQWTSPAFDRSAKAYCTSLSTMWRFMAHTVTGPGGPHGFFLEFGIDALTISVHHSHATNSIDAERVGRVLEATIRSVSNLSEKLHHSYYLYLLPSAHTFVSIEEYAFSLAIILSALAFRGFRLHFTTAPRNVLLSLAVMTAAVAVGGGALFAIASAVSPFALGKISSHTHSLSHRQAWCEVCFACAVILFVEYLCVSVLFPALQRKTWLSQAVKYARVTRNRFAFRQDRKSHQIIVSESESESVNVNSIVSDLHILPILAEEEEDTHSSRSEGAKSRSNASTLKPNPDVMQNMLANQNEQGVITYNEQENGEWKTVKVSLLLYTFYCFSAYGMINFSVAMPFAMAYVPLLLSASPRQTHTRGGNNCALILRMIHYLAMCLLSPPAILVILSYGWAPNNANADSNAIHTGLADSLANGMWRLLTQYQHAGTAILPLICFVLMPIHTVAAWLTFTVTDTDKETL